MAAGETFRSPLPLRGAGVEYAVITGVSGADGGCRPADLAAVTPVGAPGCCGGAATVEVGCVYIFGAGTVAFDCPTIAEVAGGAAGTDTCTCPGAAGGNGTGEGRGGSGMPG